MIFRLLQSVPLTPADEMVNPADSAKVALGRAVEELVTNPSQFFSELLTHAVSFGLKVLAALAVYLVGIWVIRRIKKVITKIFVRKGTEQTIVSFVNSFVSVILSAILIILTISTLGVNTTSISAILAAGGLAIGMAWSGALQNFAGGIMILVFKPFRTGDYIIAQGVEGYVEDVSIVNTKIRTFANNLIVLPNGALSNGTINNFSHKPYHRVTCIVGVPYDTDVDKAREIILGVIKADPRVLDSSTPGAKDPTVYLTALKDSSVELTCWAWVAVEDYWPVQFKLNEEIYKALPSGGVPFPFPQLDVHLDQKKA